MRQEIEYIAYPKVKHTKVFLDRIIYRNKHLHRDFELCFLLSGEGVVTVGQKSFPLSKGDGLLINSNEAHSLLGGNEGMVCLFVQISTHFLLPYVPILRKEVFESGLLSEYLDEQERKKTLDLAILCLKNYAKAASFFEFEVISTISEIFHTLLMRFPHHPVSESEVQRSKANAERVNRILSYIDEEIALSPRLEEIAKREGITTTHLSHLFSASIGMSFQEYISLRRLEEAVRLMGKGNMSMLEISEGAGFSDQKYMTKMFRKQFGCTPKEFALSPRNGVLDFVGRSPLEKIFTDEEALNYLSKLND